MDAKPLCHLTFLSLLDAGVSPDRRNSAKKPLRMTENSTVVSFPVEECEIDLGNINVHSSMEFKKFQSFLSQKIGISPHQIFVSLIRRKPSKSSPGYRRKIPITEKVDFSAILGEKDCFFYVTLMKRSRRERRGKPRRILEEENYLSPHLIDSAQEKVPPPKKILLRRNAGLVSLFYDQVTSPEYLYSGREILGFRSVDNRLWSEQDLQPITVGRTTNNNTCSDTMKKFWKPLRSYPSLISYDIYVQIRSEFLLLKTF
uniref:DUF7138 domain-containing protein n=1 Tax=Nelumbo nucifera TaxID=4432 RepID=A0A822Y3J5_NELNU|nr:TPA_asm: hypothetical protein HUJ06_029962 [Nelumbo nucifera]